MGRLIKLSDVTQCISGMSELKARCVWWKIPFLTIRLFCLLPELKKRLCHLLFLAFPHPFQRCKIWRIEVSTFFSVFAHIHMRMYTQAHTCIHTCRYTYTYRHAHTHTHLRKDRHGRPNPGFITPTLWDRKANHFEALFRVYKKSNSYPLSSWSEAPKLHLQHLISLWNIFILCSLCAVPCVLILPISSSHWLVSYLS